MIEEIKEAAAGRWLDVVTSLTSFNSEFFNGQHQACPMCGGKDRFRAFKDFNETGGCICNQCGKFADGISLLQRANNSSTAEVCIALESFLGIENKKKAIDPESNLEFIEWNDMVARGWCIGKKPITPEAMLTFGARMARYRNEHPVFAIPIYGKQFKITGWVIYAAGGGKLPKFQKGKPPEYVSVKLTAGSKPGICGPVDRIKDAKTVIKTEGITDALAGESKNSDSSIVFVSNSNGAGETPQGWIVKLFDGMDAIVVHDADQPGEDGAKGWLFALADNCQSVTQVRLPYPIQATKGKDLRDWFLEGNDAKTLLALASNTKEYEPTRTKEGVKIQTESEFPIATKRLKQLGIEVLYENEQDEIRCYSFVQRKVFTIRDISRVSLERLIQWCGGQVKAFVVKEPSTDEEMSIQDVREAIATIAASVRSDRVVECGHGVWMGQSSLDGEPTDSVIVVGGGEVARYNGDTKLKQVFDARIDGLVVDMSNQAGWYEFDRLEAFVEQAQSIEWRRGVVGQLYSLFGQWHFSRESDSELLVGLILASWIQSVWQWRPLVSVSGPSGSGKTTLLLALEAIFGQLAWRKDNVTEAGLRQSVGRTSKIIMLDEFEDSASRQKVLSLLRTSSRGGTVVRGTAGGKKSEEYGLRHIAWVAAIETGIVEHADANRFIDFELKIPPPDEYRRFEVPDHRALDELGMKALACAIVACKEAREIAIQLVERENRFNQRLTECYSAPIAATAAICGLATQVDQITEKLICEIPNEDATPETDEEILIRQIMTKVIDLPGGRKRSIGQCLSFYAESQDSETRSRLESCGILIDGDETIFHAAMISELIGRKGNLTRILKRVPEAKWERIRMNGSQPRVVKIKSEYLIGVKPFRFRKNWHGDGTAGGT